METLELVAQSDAITDVVGATVAMSNIRDIEKEIAEIKEQAAQHAEWFASRVAAKQRQIDYHTGRLERYAASTGQKSLILPVGKVGFHTTQKVEWPDEEVLVTFCVRYQLPFREKKEVDKKALAAFIAETGTYPAGYRKVPTTTFHVNVKGDDDE